MSKRLMLLLLLFIREASLDLSFDCAVCSMRVNIGLLNSFRAAAQQLQVGIFEKEEEIV